jgi:hypothetical protein
MFSFEINFFQPKPAPTPKRYPSWASWGSRDQYLPAEFHTLRSFRKYLGIVREDFADSSMVEGGKIDSPLLLLGLMYREVSRALEVEPGDENETPSHIQNSPLGIKELDEMQSVVKDLEFDEN